MKVEQRKTGFLIRDDVKATITCSPSSLYLLPVRGMAGHSKWQNIRHIKGEKDKQKGDLSIKFANRIRIAVKDGGGADPKFNSQLERVIVDAKKANMAMSLIENTIKGASVTAPSSTIVELKFLGNCILVIEIATTKPQLVKNEMQKICKKIGGKVESGCSAGVFDKKGIIHVMTTETPDLDAALELAIEVGAEDVSVEADEDDLPFLEFTCGDKDLHVVRKQLVAKSQDVIYSEYEYLPTQMYPLDDNAFVSLERLVSKLSEHPDVVKIFDNAATLE